MSINHQTAPQPDWYVEKRKKVEQFFVEAKFKGEKSEFTSPSGRYKLEVQSHATGEKTWNYTRGLFYRDGELIADVKRNYSMFPFSWFEDHVNGHDYVFCGEDYQGLTVIELDTGRRVDHIPEEANQGVGFCRAGYSPFPNDKTKLLVEGCFWACPYELLVADITDPMVLPWKEQLFTEHEGAAYADFVGVSADGTELVFEDSEKIVDDGREFNELSREERKPILDDRDLYHRLREKITRFHFSLDGTLLRTVEEIRPGKTGESK